MKFSELTQRPLLSFSILASDSTKIVYAQPRTPQPLQDKIAKKAEICKNILNTEDDIRIINFFQISKEQLLVFSLKPNM